MYSTNKDRYSSSSDDDYNSSSDDFPSPSSPKKKPYKRDDDDYGTLFNKLNEMQKRLYHLEIKKRKETAVRKDERVKR